MEILAPDYYEKFKCIAGECRHNCCIGWEIDIDSQTAVKYKDIHGDFGDKLNKSIIYENDETVHFRLGKDERCPLLNSDGLCDIILNLGESSLCQICNDHPRFRNFYSHRTEIGLGLCCEAAAKLILGQRDKVKLIRLTDCDEKCSCNYEETEFFKIREKVFALLQDRNKSVEYRVNAMLDMFGAQMILKSPSEWAEDFLRLERLDSKWDEYISKIMLADNLLFNSPLPDGLQIPFEQLSVYLAYRHFTLYFDGYVFSQIALFIALSFNIIKWLCLLEIDNKGRLAIDDMVDYARMYSAEIEYSDENIYDLLEILAE
ncbi:MAG: flagellin lysine-N-methylase [Candidatus Fimenecus sp.]